jgi:hypothetical protein
MVEQEAARWGKAGTYVEPFALRALGVVRGDAALLARAIERFDALGLAWDAAKTRALTLHSRPRRLLNER